MNKQNTRIKQRLINEIVSALEDYKPPDCKHCVWGTYCGNICNREVYQCSRNDCVKGRDK